MKFKLSSISGLIGLLILTMLCFNNCGQVDFASNNEKPAALEMDPGNTENGLLPADEDHKGSDDHDWNKHSGCKKSCGNNGVKDIIVNIDHIEIRGTHGEVLVLTGDLGETSIIGGTLPIFVSKDIDIVSIRLVLKDAGNVLIDDDNKSFDLKTPSGQQSGIKIPFRGVQSVKGGAYNLNFSIDAETQIVKAGKKCLLKPVLKFLSFKPIS